MKHLLILLIVSFYFFSCKKNSNELYSDSFFLKAGVAQTSDISCGKPVLDFSDDSIAIKRLTGYNSIFYTVIDLPSEFNVQNKKLYVLVRKLKPGEEFVCLAIGFWYPPLKIIEVKDR